MLARSQARLALRLLAYGLVHVPRAHMEATTRQSWSLRGVRGRLLKAAARVQRHARRLVVILERRAAAQCRALLKRLTRLMLEPG